MEEFHTRDATSPMIGGDMSDTEQLLRTTLNELASLPAGWLDGNAGQSIAARAIDRGGDVIDILTPPWRRAASVFPTEHGGVQFYWPTANQLSIDVEPSGALYIHACDTRTTFQTATIPADTPVRDQLAAWFTSDPSDAENLTRHSTNDELRNLDRQPRCHPASDTNTVGNTCHTR